MTHNIFYSWQSDIDVSDNKNYIEKCLRRAISRLSNDIDFSIYLDIDKATNKRVGTIDISDSIFKKINTSKIFVADVSIINFRTKKYKKTPNPNVLIELGYAARTLGWENIICVFNTKYGTPEMLPFDLRNRRVLLYNSDKNKDELVDALFSAISNTHNLNTPSGIISDYYNAKIDTLLLTIISDFGKLSFGYNNYSLTRDIITEILNIDKIKLIKTLTNCHLIGFQLFKNYDIVIRDLAEILEKILVLKQYDDSYYIPLINIIDCLRLYNKNLNRRWHLDKLEIISESSDYSIVESNDKNLPNRYILLRNIENGKNSGQVCDFGDFHRRDHIESLLTNFTLKNDSLRFYSGFICEMLEYINKWIDNNGGEFILDETILEYR